MIAAGHFVATYFEGANAAINLRRGPVRKGRVHTGDDGSALARGTDQSSDGKLVPPVRTVDVARPEFGRQAVALPIHSVFPIEFNSRERTRFDPLNQGADVPH